MAASLLSYMTVLPNLGQLFKKIICFLRSKLFSLRFANQFLQKLILVVKENTNAFKGLPHLKLDSFILISLNKKIIFLDPCDCCIKCSKTNFLTKSLKKNVLFNALISVLMYPFQGKYDRETFLM